MRASFLSLLFVSLFVVTDVAAEISSPDVAQTAATGITTVSSATEGVSTNWLKRKKRRPAYRRLRAHRR
ncbi:hypothetical protein [Hymenobacter perfusus]|uniref:RxLR effector protein n=1 Tax=Hymenobacter perfusus TaxID=1236770 RepID=A0A428K8L2_9BACT|nr:hypothetical protein [Hymenobacter perfusus]RSK42720.1 hypothetical protein EI293_13040 [Hymenobacter perfusus]